MDSGAECSEVSPMEDKMQKLNSNEEFKRLLPGYTEYWENKPKAREPYLHGTGSYALRQILENGLSPRKEEERVTGEATQLSLGTPKTVISLAVDNEAGEIVARTYAFASSNEIGLVFNCDKYSDKDRVARTITAIGGNEAFVERVLLKSVKDLNSDYAQEKRKTLNFETDVLWKNALRYGAYVFSPEMARNNIVRLKSLAAGEVTDFETIRTTLFLNGILQGRTTGEVAGQIPDIKDSQSSLRKHIDNAIKGWEDKIKQYEGLPDSEREEIEHQFPAVLMIEGAGNAVENPNLPLQEERVAIQTIPPESIREIRVPEKYVATVNGWLKEKGLGNIVVTPLEYYEIHEVLGDN